MNRIIEKNTLKNFSLLQNCTMFASTVLATLKPERDAYQGESFAFIGFPLQINTPSMPLLIGSESTLRRFFHLYEYSIYDLR